MTAILDSLACKNLRDVTLTAARLVASGEIGALQGYLRFVVNFVVRGEICCLQ